MYFIINYQLISYLCPVKQVLIAAPISNSFKQTLIDKGYELVYVESNQQLSTVNSQLSTAIITSNKLALHKSVLEQFTNLKWIARLGSGMEIIDTNYCDEHDIRYVNSPQGIANTVAEHVLGMLLSLQHKIHSSLNEIKKGQWIRDANRGTELENLTVGIIGYGHTGFALANKLTVFTKHILVYDKYKTDIENKMIENSTLEKIQQEADIISFHVPLNEETNHYYNEGFMNAMRKSHILINASRGAVAETKIILAGLQSGKISGACLDVLEEEKSISSLLTQNENIVQELLKYNVIITPHIAGYSFNAIEKMSAELLLQLRQCL